ncbi:hypothetical protein BC833DRAFT_603791 [Globomyces pollinis-pini]|nr:hypothetical protein BC833DRAFT_603791 [Globomyces pollinis-pini]
MINDPLPAKLYVYGTGFIIGGFSLLSSIYVIYRILVRYYKSKRALAVAVRFPLYLAIIESFIFFQITYFQIYVLQNGHLLSGESCKIAAMFFMMGALANVFTVSVYSILIYFQIVLKKQIKTGRYDWKLLLSVFLVSMSSATLMYSSYGESRYWCFANNSDDITIPLVLSFIFQIGIFTLIITLYVLTMKSLKNLERGTELHHSSAMNGQTTMNQFNNNQAKQHLELVRNLENLMSKNMLGYIINFVIQWVPGIHIITLTT